MHSIERNDDDGQDNDEPQEQPPSAGMVKEVQGDWQGYGKRYSNKTHTSRTDPDARLYSKSRGRSASLSFLVHDVIDTKSCVILGRRASIATGTAEREVALELVAEHEARRHILGLDQAVEVLTADAGYGAGSFVAELLDRGITPHVPLLSASEVEALPTWQRRTFNLARQLKRRVKRREAEARNKVRLESKGHGYAASRKLRMRSEHIFAEAKNQHGLGRARHRSLAKVNRQSMLIATVQNLKRLMKALRNNAKGAEAAVLRRFDALHHAIFRSILNWEAAWPTRQKEPDLQPIAAHAAKMVRLSVINPT
jgi:IS5 family transposase